MPLRVDNTVSQRGDPPIPAESSTHKRRREPSDEGLDDWNDLALDPEDYDHDWNRTGEAPKLGSQVLPVAALPNDYNGEPTDGLEYLFLVRRDALTRPGVTRVDNPYHVESAKPVKVPAHDMLHPSIPTDEWKRRFEQRFVDLRLALIKKMQEPRSADLVTTPKFKDRDGWWKFINGGLKLGTPALQPALDIQEIGQLLEEETILSSSKVGLIKMESLEDNSAASENDEDDSESEVDFLATKGDGTFIQMTGIINDVQPSPSALKPAETIPTPPMSTFRPTRSKVTNSLVISSEYHPTLPSTEIITQLENKAAFYLLMFFTFWINTRLDRLRTDNDHSYNPLALCDNDAKWIFCLLARLDEALAGEQISTLRELARACLSLLLESLKGANAETIQKSVERQTGRDSCWMVIAAVAKGWGQRDLWEDAVQAVNALCL
ncbi:hypothetical protein FRB96_002297 [Tulasnella sp. 330]|nr:hypothetical protein FRB96_002297 [Tulasnella sp. 330]